MIHISSGESDAYVIKVEANEPEKIEYNQTMINLNSTAATSTITNSHVCGSWCTHGTYDYFTTTPTVYWPYYNNHYFYQVKCPKKSCKTFNWLEIDVIKPCTNCGSKLKAVSNQADFEIPVGK